MNETKDKSIRVMAEIHQLLYRRWKDKRMSIRDQITELVNHSKKYKDYREAKNA